MNNPQQTSAVEKATFSTVIRCYNQFNELIDSKIFDSTTRSGATRKSNSWLKGTFFRPMMKQSEIVSTVRGYGPGRNTTLTALNELVKNGEATITTGPHNAKLYSVV